jgi:hypothetical protein
MNDSDILEVLPSAPKLDDGKYNGTITKVSRRTDPYMYTDYEVAVDVTGNVKLTVGFPTELRESGAHFQFLKQFDTNLKVGDRINPMQLVLNRKVTFLVNSTKSKKNGLMYCNIVATSVKPI